MRRLVASFAVLLVLLAPAFAQTRFSQITAASSPPALTDSLIAVLGGNDRLVTTSQLLTALGAGPWQDTSAVVGSLASYWTTSGPAIVGKFNRSFIGEATKNNTGNDSSGPFSWVETLVGGLVASSQLSVGSTVGQLGITGYTRVSDAVTATGSHSSINAQGVTGFSYNDDTSGLAFTIAVGANMIAAMKTGVTTGIAIGNQLDINNAATPAVINPNAVTPNAGSMAALLTSGAYSTLATQNASAALAIGSGRAGGPIFNAGIVIGAGTVASTSGTLGAFSRAMELPLNSGFTWFGTGSTEVAGLEVDNSGNMLLAGNNLKINGTTAVTCSGTPTASFAAIDGIVTHC